MRRRFPVLLFDRYVAKSRSIVERLRRDLETIGLSEHDLGLMVNGHKQCEYDIDRYPDYNRL